MPLDGVVSIGRVRVGSAEKENLEKLKLESSLGEVTKNRADRGAIGKLWEDVKE